MYRTGIKDKINELENESKGNVIFNDTLNTLYLRLYGVRHSDSER